MYGIHHLVGAFSFAFCEAFLFFRCLLLIPPLTEAAKITDFVVQSKNSRLGSFYGFAADRTVHKEIISILSNTKNAQPRLGIFYYLFR